MYLDAEIDNFLNSLIRALWTERIAACKLPGQSALGYSTEDNNYRLYIKVEFRGSLGFTIHFIDIALPSDYYTNKAFDRIVSTAKDAEITDAIMIEAEDPALIAWCKRHKYNLVENTNRYYWEKRAS